MACLCIHNHLTSIRLRSRDLIGRNTSVFLDNAWPEFLLPCCWIYVSMHYQVSKISVLYYRHTFGPLFL